MEGDSQKLCNGQDSINIFYVLRGYELVFPFLEIDNKFGDIKDRFK